MQAYEMQQPQESIAQANGVSRWKIRQHLKAHGITSRKTGPIPSVSPEDIDAMVARYAAGESTHAIAEDYDMTFAAINWHLQQRGTELRPRSTKHGKVYTLDHHYFDSIDTHEKAYWLGYFAADGWVGVGGRQLQFGQAERDSPMLHQFRDALGSNHKVVVKRNDLGQIKGAPMHTINLSSKQMVKALAKYGIAPCKTETCQWPSLPAWAYPAFVRGYLDGDGYVSPHNGRERVGFLGTEAFLEGLKQHVEDQLGITGPVVNQKGSEAVHTIVWTGHNATDILNWLYAAPGPRLERKRGACTAGVKS